MGFLRPDHDAEATYIAIESRGFAKVEYDKTEREVTYCEKELERIEANNDEDTFKGGSAIAAAYEKLGAAERARNAALVKLNWEKREEWKKRISTNKKLTKQLLAQIDWKNIRRP